MGRCRDDLQVLLRWGDDVVAVRRFSGAQVADRGLWTSDLGLTELRDARRVWKPGDVAPAEGTRVALAIAPPAMDGSELVADLQVLPAFTSRRAHRGLAGALGIGLVVGLCAAPVAPLGFGRGARAPSSSAPAASACLEARVVQRTPDAPEPGFVPPKEIAPTPADDPGTRRPGVEQAGGRPRMSRPAGTRAIGGDGGSSSTHPFDAPIRLGSGAEGGAARRTYAIEQERSPIRGGLPADVIQRVVRENFGRLRLCYESALDREAPLSARVTVAFLIAPDGRVPFANVVDANVSRAVWECVASAFTGIQFPAPEGGAVRVTYPIVFAPA